LSGRLKTNFNFFKSNFLAEFKKYEPFVWFLIFLSWIIAIMTFWKVYSLISANGGWVFIANDKFDRQMASGVTAHLITFGKAIFVLLFAISRNGRYKRYIYPTLIVLFLSVFFLMVKYHLLWLIMIAFFINNIGKPVKIQIKKTVRIALVLAGILVFYFIFLSFFWQTFSFSNSKLWEFFGRTFLNYFITGPILLDFWMHFPAIKPDWTLSIVFINAYHTIIGMPNLLNPLDFVSINFISVIPGIASNVATSFGVYYLIGGTWFTFFISFVNGAVLYIVYLKTFRTKTVVFIFLSCFFLTISTLSFFVQYFTLLAMYEFPIYFIGLIFIFNIFIKLKKL